MEEQKFALAVEEVCTMVATPEYRQLLIEATHVLGTLMMHDTEKQVHMECVVVEEIVEVANLMFLLDQVSITTSTFIRSREVLFHLFVALRHPTKKTIWSFDTNTTTDAYLYTLVIRSLFLLHELLLPRLSI